MKERILNIEHACLAASSRQGILNVELKAANRFLLTFTILDPVRETRIVQERYKLLMKLKG